MVNHCGNLKNVLIHEINTGGCHYRIQLHEALTTKAHLLKYGLLQGLLISAIFNQFTWTVVEYWSLRRFSPKDSEEGRRMDFTQRQYLKTDNIIFC